MYLPEVKVSRNLCMGTYVILSLIFSSKLWIHKIQSLVIETPTESTFNNKLSKILTGKFQPIGN